MVRQVDKNAAKEIANLVAKAHGVEPKDVTHLVTLLVVGEGMFVSGCEHVTDVLAMVFEEVDPTILEAAAIGDDGAVREHAEGPRTTFAEYIFKRKLKMLGLDEVAPDILERVVGAALMAGSREKEDEKEPGGYL